MVSWKKFSVLVRKRETPFYDFVYQVAKKVKSISIPRIPVFHNFLYNEWIFRTSVWHNFWRVIYYEPIFKSQCIAVGKNFYMEYAGNGSAKIRGNLRLTIGDNVKIFDNTIFVGLKVLDNPTMIVGDNTYLGPFVRFMVAMRVTVGSYCMITSRIITDNPGHSVTNIITRLTSGGGSPSKSEIKPITIGDFCFLPLDTVVYPGVNIGDGVVARIGTHISRDVPPFCQIAGNPMRIIKKIPIPEELRDIVGEERYRQYHEIHNKLEL